MGEVVAAPVARWRMVVFWVLMVLLLFLQVGERPESLGWLFAAFSGFPEGAGATHELHWFTISAYTWAVTAAILVNLRRPAAQVGAAWTYGLGTVLAFGLILAIADLPADVVPILMGALVIAALAFFAHPSSLRAKVTPVERPSRVLLALVVVAAVPLVLYAIGQLRIHLGSGVGDEHFEFGHWVVMGMYGLTAPVLGLVAASKVSGWRVPLWVTGLLVAALGVGSLGITAVSRLGTPWALLAVVWGVAFIAAGEREARSGTAPVRGAPPSERVDRPTAEPLPR
jgi:hypothetical protein